MSGTVDSNREYKSILFADIEGYGAIMHQDESEAISILTRFKKKMASTAPLHDGEIVKFFGDECLVLFPDTSKALDFAYDIQVEFGKGKKVPLRVGIHEGEILRKDKDVYGDAVNIASRIEAIGAAGAVIMSKTAFQNVQNEYEYPLKSLGRYRLSSIKDKVEIFCLDRKNIYIPISSDLKVRRSLFSYENYELLIPIIATLAFLVVTFIPIFNTETQESSDAPSIAVLPFDDMSPNKDQTYFADGVAEEILNTIAKFEGLEVAGRTSSFSFKGKKATIEEIGKALDVNHVLEGSIRKSGNQVRVTAQLIDVHSGYHKWSETYDRSFEDIFAIQDELAQNIGKVLLEKLLYAQNSNKDVSTANSEAYDLFLKAKYLHMNSYIVNYDQDDFYKSERLFKESIALDPTYADAYAGLADLYDTHVDILPEFKSMSHTAPYYDSLRMEAIEKAYDLQPNSAYVNEIKGFVLCTQASVHCDFGSAFSSFEKSYALNRNSANCLRGMALAYSRLGLVDDAIKINNKALEMDPLMLPTIFGQAINNGKLGKLKEALKIAESAADIDSKNLFALYFKGKNYALLGMKQEALDNYQRMDQLDPNYAKRFQINEIIKSYLNGTSDDKNWNDSNSNSIDLMVLDFLKGNTEELKKRYQQTYESNSDEQSSIYLILKNDPLNSSFRDAPWLKKIIQREKVKYDQLLNTYPRAESILGLK